MTVPTTRYRGFLRAQIPMPQYDGTQACFGLDTNDFYAAERPAQRETSSQSVQRQNKAMVRICQGCSFVNECGDYAIAHEAYGVWGGLTGLARDQIRRERGWALTSPHEVDVIFRDTNMASER